MFCSQCGKQISDTAKFCTACGAPVQSPVEKKETISLEKAEDISFEPKKRKRKPTAKKMMKEGQWVTSDVAFCQDGKYRWVYELSLLKNPTFFVLVWKIFFFIILGIFVFITLIDVFSGDMDSERFLDTLKVFGYFIIGMTVISVLGYLLYAAIMGGKYIVMFEMDERGILHKQLPKQATKAKAIGMITVMLGAASGNFGAMSAGLGSQRTSMYSEFARVRKVIPYPHRNLIKVNERFGHNQVYVSNESFDFVLKYITERVPKGQ